MEVFSSVYVKGFNLQNPQVLNDLSLVVLDTSTGEAWHSESL